MEKHKVGEVLYYCEGGMVLNVRIVEDKSDAEWERYKLKVLEVVKEAQIVGLPLLLLKTKSSLRKGSIFTCEKSKESICCGPMIWSLLDKKRSEALRNILEKDKRATLVWC